MIESFVDLTYRGLSLGRRIRLSQVRPSSGFLELATPMPVGTHVAIAAEDGVTFDATVSAVHEQVAGSERTPGMVVVPAIVADPAASWWKARVALPDEDRPAPRPARNRPVTQAPRSPTDPAGPAGPDESGAVAEEIPATLADLTIRVATAPDGAPAHAGGDLDGPDGGGAGEGDAASDDGEVSETSEPGDAGGSGKPAPGGGPKKRRKRR